MKTIVHRSDSRGYANHGWLQANHSFSFAGFYNPEKVHFGALRVLNDDMIAPSMGFGTHPHDNMEIITIPLKGVLKHRDSMHNEWQAVLPGEVQVMSAGTGVQHSEINGSAEEHLGLFQIWVFPDKQNVAPRYDQKSFDATERKNKLQTLVTSIDENHEGSLKIHQDAVLSRIDLDKGQTFNYKLKSDKHGVYVMNIYGEFLVDGKTLETRDAIGVSETLDFNIEAKEESSILFIEVPMEF
ncbi:MULTISPECIES: pirin family protein [Aestuariibaculum]|uniref:Pirin family protein n=1 Tax=Aestuariibaculum lutulentum TaxID=2920935 RepID=A0ABS9RI44_9FLAO|nr:MULTISPECIES: pirin family protein [Aestuariibaculum]MCH4552625.1 pirin family protein [Aestuariibaculum lutulentum]MCR8668141.1 pirin family protein [Aestuariibaculum sp. M13]